MGLWTGSRLERVQSVTRDCAVVQRSVRDLQLGRYTLFCAGTQVDCEAVAAALWQCITLRCRSQDDSFLASISH